MSTHSSIFAWRILWTEDPGELQSMGSQRVQCDREAEQHFTDICMYSFPRGSVVKNPPANAEDAGDTGLIPGLGRPPRGGLGNLLQYSCLENPMDRGAWQVIVYGVARVRQY